MEQRYRTRVMSALVAIAGCSSSVPGSQPGDAAPEPGRDGASDGAPDSAPDGASGGPPLAAFDCSAIQGPLSTNRFYEDNPTYTDPVDDSASWTLSTPEA